MKFSLPVAVPVALALPALAAIEPESYPEFRLETPYRLEIVAANLRIPWSLAMLPDGRLLVSERQGRVRVVAGGVLVEEPALALEVPIRSTNGFLGLAVHPDFERNRYVYLAVNEQRGEGPVLKIVRYRERHNRLVDPQVILDDLPASWNHTGCRLLFGPDGKLYVTVGDANRPELTQRLDLLNGKILRVNDDGSVPGDNPLLSREGARPEIYSYGHRNAQGIDFHPVSKVLWSSEHGPGFLDEFNRVLPGANYGWGVIQGLEEEQGMKAPEISMVDRPAMAPGGMAFYGELAFPELRHRSLIAIMQGQGLMVVTIHEGRATEAKMLFNRRFGRIRDVMVAPDGSIYFCTSMFDNRGLRMLPPQDGYDMVLRLVPARFPQTNYAVLPNEFSLDAPEVAARTAAAKTDKSTADLVALHCESCHGPGLAGDMHSSLVDGKWSMAHDDNSRYYLIANGLPNKAMPAFEGELTPQQIHAVMQHIKQREPRD